MLWFAYPPGTSRGLAWLALVPWAYAIHRAQRKWEACLYSACFGLSWAYFAFEWLVTAVSPTPGSLGPYAGAAFLLQGMVVVVACCAGSALWRLDRHGWPMVITLPCIWLVSEQVLDGILRNVAGTTLDLQRLAITQSSGSPLLQLADLGGAPAVSGIVAAVNGAGVDLLIQAKSSPGQKRRFAYTTRLAMGLICLAFVYSGWRIQTLNQQQGVAAGLVPAGFDSEDERQSHPQLGDVSFVVWPETAMTTDWIESEGPPGPSVRLARQIKRPLVIGCRRFCEHPVGLHNSALVISERGQVVGYADKRFLAPFHEAELPISRYIPLLVPPVDYCLTQIFRGAVGSPRPLRLGEWTVGIGICHDVCFSEWSSDLTKARANLLLLIGNETFDKSGVAASRMLASTQLRAVECRRSILRCVVGGKSGVVDGLGQFQLAVDERVPEAGVCKQRIPICNEYSFYASRGTGPIWAFVALLSLGAACEGWSDQRWSDRIQAA